MIIIHSVDEKDRSFVIQVLKNVWGSEKIVYSGQVFDAGSLPGFLAKENERVVGLLTYSLEDTFLQIISINALTPGKGIGTALIEKVKKTAKEKHISRIIVVTTNENHSALAFYQKRGFVIRNIRKGAVSFSRKVKPEIPLLGENGIPLEDEIELELSV